jgi:hypothetical protein
VAFGERSVSTDGASRGPDRVTVTSKNDRDVQALRPERTEPQAQILDLLPVPTSHLEASRRSRKANGGKSESRESSTCSVCLRANR